MKLENTITKYRHWIFACLLILFSGFLLWKCRCGYGNIDESFYLTIPYRFYQGDSLIFHEWHMSQMAGLLTLPLVASFVSLTGGTTGIILFMRYACTLVQIAIAGFVYCRLHKINWMGALIAAISFVIYIPFGIMALSYNSMGIMALFVCLTIVLTAEKKKHLQYTIAGLFYAAAVLCCPYLAIVFFLYLVIVLAVQLFNKLKHRTQPSLYLWTIPGAFFLVLGAAIAALGFFLFLFSRARLGDTLHSLGGIMSDPEHPIMSFADVVKLFFSAILFINPWTKYIYCALAVLAVVCLADRKRIARRAVYFSLAAIGYLLLMVSFIHFKPYINYFMWPINILALFAALLTRSKGVKHFFWIPWATGMLYAFCINASSNQQFYVISSTSTVALLGSVLMIAFFVKELSAEESRSALKSIAIATVFLVMAFQITTQTISRYNSVFWEDGGMVSLTEKIEMGTNAGIYASEENKNSYYEAVENLAVLDSYDFEKILFLSRNTWYYLFFDARSSAYSAWLAMPTELDVNRFGTYFAITRDKFPDVVYADGDYIGFVDTFCNEFGYVVDRTEPVYILVKADSADQ